MKCPCEAKIHCTLTQPVVDTASLGIIWLHGHSPGPAASLRATWMCAGVPLLGRLAGPLPDIHPKLRDAGEMLMECHSEIFKITNM